MIMFIHYDPMKLDFISGNLDISGELLYKFRIRNWHVYLYISLSSSCVQKNIFTGKKLLLMIHRPVVTFVRFVINWTVACML